MPNTPEHPVLDLEAFALKQERAERKALIDYAFWGAATPKNIEQFVPLHKQGCVGFKAFTVYAGSNYPFSDEYSQLKEMEKVASFHGIFGAHAEDGHWSTVFQMSTRRSLGLWQFTMQAVPGLRS